MNHRARMEFVPRLTRERQRCRDNSSLHAQPCSAKAPGSQEFPQTWLYTHPGRIFCGVRDGSRPCEAGGHPVPQALAVGAKSLQDCGCSSNSALAAGLGLESRDAFRAGCPPYVPKADPGGSVAVAGGVTQRDRSRVPPTSPLPGPITRAPTCLPHSHAPKISSLNPSRVGRARLVPSGWGTQAERGVPAQR